MKKLGLFTTTLIAASMLALFGCNDSAKETTTVAQATPLKNAVMKVAFNQPANHPEFIALEKFSDKLSEATKGNFYFEIFPNELLGSQQNSIELVQNGTIPFSIVAGSLLENWNEEFKVFSLPYVFKDFKHLKSIVTNKDIVGDLYKSLEQQNITVLCAFYTGSRSIYTKKGIQILTPNDLKGLKLRTIQSESMVNMFKATGVKAIPMNQGDVYSSLLAGTIDAAENNEVTYLALKLNEVAPIYNNTRHLIMPDFLIVNTNYLNSLPESVRKFFDENINDLIENEFNLYDESIQKAREEAKEKGVTFVDPNIEEFKVIANKYVEEILQTDSAKKLYEVIQKSYVEEIPTELDKVENSDTTSNEETKMNTETESEVQAESATTDTDAKDADVKDTKAKEQ